MISKVLFITNKQDEHTDYLVKKLGKDNVTRFNTDDFLSENTAFLSIENHQITFDDEVISLNRLNEYAGYLRRPEKIEFISEIEDKFQQDVIASESRDFLFQFFYLLREIKWLNSPDKILCKDGKLHHMMVANKVGLNVPKFIVTHTEHRVLSFVNKHKKVVIKPLCNNFSYLDGDLYKTFYTEMIDTESFLKLNSSSIRNCPTFLQEYIKPAYELRITYVAGDFFVAIIHSEVTDWRKDYDNVRYEVGEIPNFLMKQINKLMKSLGLNFGCIDMIFDGKSYYFLEVNKNGQWLWIEEETGLKISDSIIDYLTKI